MESIKIENLRCFKDTHKISLKPLTIAVGKNSSGKSTLLRVFPLFKQTMETKLSEPILWYGRYVDFGEFTESKSKFSELEETINFEFEFTTNSSLLNNDRVQGFVIKPIRHLTDDLKVKVKLYISESYIKQVDVSIFDYKIEMLYNDETVDIKINDKVLKTETIQTLNIDKIIPSIKVNDTHHYIPLWMRDKDTFNKLKKDNLLLNLIVDILDKTNVKTNQFLYATYIFSTLTENFAEFDVKIRKIKQFLLNPDKDSYVFLMSSAIDNKKKFKPSKEAVADIMMYISDNEYEIKKHILVYNISKIIDLCNSYLSKYFKNIRYIAPVRATAQRYYRKQGLDIQEVDARGENVSAILQGMRSAEKKKFDIWLEDNFGFKIYTQTTEGHISLYVENKTIKTNIADTGFGYSQILPIILMIWKNTYENQDVDTQIVIEQPELHLHPKMQLQLIDLILKIISTNKKTKFLIETHSEKIINYIGEQIELKSVNADDIEVLLVEQNENNISNIRNVNYTTSGYLQEWPIDFF